MMYTINLLAKKKPAAVHRFLSKIIEEARTSKGLTGREIYGVAGGMHGDHDDHGDGPDYADIDGDGVPD